MSSFRAFRIRNDDAGYRAALEDMRIEDLTPGQVLVKSSHSSVNYKDALAGSGQGKILRQFPLNGGIDVAGHVVASADARFREGDAVLCTGSGLSETRDGGYGEFVRLEADSTIALPSGLSLRDAMALGTAGFTAALSLHRMIENGQSPGMGPIVVTGATGGVGMLAIDILSRAGFAVHAISGKADHASFLESLGASEVIARQQLVWGQRALEATRWAGAIDNVGGEMLSGLTRVIQPYGNIASCGMAGGADLTSTVMPFIIRGVSLLGIASAGTPRPVREAIWQHLSTDWKPVHLDRIVTREVGLSDLAEIFPGMLAGGSFGRTVVKLG